MVVNGQASSCTASKQEPGLEREVEPPSLLRESAGKSTMYYSAGIRSCGEGRAFSLSDGECSPERTQPRMKAVSRGMHFKLAHCKKHQDLYLIQRQLYGAVHNDDYPTAMALAKALCAMENLYGEGQTDIRRLPIPSVAQEGKTTHDVQLDRHKVRLRTIEPNEPSLSRSTKPHARGGSVRTAAEVPELDHTGEIQPEVHLVVAPKGRTEVQTTGTAQAADAIEALPRATSPGTVSHPVRRDHVAEHPKPFPLPFPLPTLQPTPSPEEKADSQLGPTLQEALQRLGQTTRDLADRLRVQTDWGELAKRHESNMRARQSRRRHPAPAAVTDLSVEVQDGGFGSALDGDTATAAAAAAAAAAVTAGRGERHLTCTICWEAPKNMMCVPCHHVLYCESCAATATVRAYRRCPLCHRCTIGNMKIYL